MIDVVESVQAWHAAAWPDASDELVALKLCEEAGEVAAAVGKRMGPDAVLEECADVVIVALAVARRFGSPADMVSALEHKFAMVSR